MARGSCWLGEAAVGRGSGRWEPSRIRAWLGARRRIGRVEAGLGGSRGCGSWDHPALSPGRAA